MWVSLTEQSRRICLAALNIQYYEKMKVDRWYAQLITKELQKNWGLPKAR